MKKKLIIIGMFILLNALLIVSTVSFFSFDSSIIVDQKIAKFVFDANQNDVISVPVTDLKPGDSSSYSFQVKNNLDSKVSDVTVIYQCIIKTMHLIPLDIKLYKIDTEDSLILTCDETYGRNENNYIVCNTAEQEMIYNEEKVDNYRLDIQFPEQYNDLEYSELIDFVDIEIRSWQKLEGN